MWTARLSGRKLKSCYLPVLFDFSDFNGYNFLTNILSGCYNKNPPSEGIGGEWKHIYKSLFWKEKAVVYFVKKFLKKY